VQVRLEQFGRHNSFGPGVELQGSVGLSLFLKGELGDVSKLSGGGRLEVPNGKLYRLPPLLDLIKAVGLSAPDKTAFERARLQFAVEGQQVQIRKLDLLGRAINLRGKGTVNIDGTDLFLDFNADPGMLGGMYVPLLTDAEQMFSDQLLKIKVRGKLTEPQFEKDLFPGIVEPTRWLLGTGE